MKSFVLSILALAGLLLVSDQVQARGARGAGRGARGAGRGARAGRAPVRNAARRGARAGARRGSRNALARGGRGIGRGFRGGRGLGFGYGGAGLGLGYGFQQQLVAPFLGAGGFSYQLPSQAFLGVGGYSGGMQLGGYSAGACQGTQQGFTQPPVVGATGVPNITITQVQGSPSASGGSGQGAESPGVQQGPPMPPAK